MILHKDSIKEAFLLAGATEMAFVSKGVNYPEDQLMDFPDDWFIVTLNRRPTTLPYDSGTNIHIYLSLKGYILNKDDIIKRYGEVWGKDNSVAQNEEIVKTMFYKTHIGIEQNTRKYLESLEKEITNARNIYVANFC